MGTVWAAAPTSATHNSLPVRESNARIRSSIVPATKTNPPAVAILPPRLGVPEGAIPCASSYFEEPSGTLQAISPVFTLTADNSPHGGCWQGQSFSSFQNNLRRAAGRPSCSFILLTNISPRLEVLKNTYA